MKRIDLTSQVFGRLTVLSLSSKRSKDGGIYFDCVCTCGNNKTVSSLNLRKGSTKSCGCLARELSSKRAKAIFTKPKTQCLVDGCESTTEKGGKGLCGKHAQRMRRHGDVNFVTSESQRRLLSREAQIKNILEVKPTTYRKFLGRHEHRVVAEQMIGRSLTSDDHVHHKDGNKHNNDPSNLEVMTRSEHLKLHAEERRKNKCNSEPIKPEQ